MSGTITPRTATVNVSGEIDVATRNVMRDILTRGLHPGPVHLAVDLSAVTFMDAAGIGVLIGAWWEAAFAGGSLTMRAPSPAVRLLVDVLGLGDMLSVCGGTPAGR